MTESTSLSTNKVIVLPDGRKLILPSPDSDQDLKKVITPAFLKQVPNGTISRRQSKIRHKVKKRQPRGMNGTSNRAGAAYAGVDDPEEIAAGTTERGAAMEKLLMQNKFLPKTKEERLYKRGGPQTTRPTYDVDTFGLQRSSHKREGVQNLILPNGKVLKLK